MSALMNVLVALAAVTLILVRQFKPQQLGGDRRWWMHPRAAAVLLGEARRPDRPAPPARARSCCWARRS